MFKDIFFKISLEIIMERKLIKFFRKNDFNWVHHYSGKVTYVEISKYLKYIT